MTHPRTNITAVGLLLVMTVLLVIGGCGLKPRPTVYDEPTVPYAYWETAWVEPRIVLADSVFTLIRADRVDSIFVQVDPENPPHEPPTIEFAVPAESCFVSVNLALASHRGIAYPLIARFLRRGNYKLTVNQPINLDEFPSREAIELRANICGVPKVVPVIR